MEELLPNSLVKIMDKGEGISIEFKEAKKKLPDSLFESICSMQRILQSSAENSAVNRTQKLTTLNQGIEPRNVGLV